MAAAAAGFAGVATLTAVATEALVTAVLAIEVSATEALVTAVLAIEVSATEALAIVDWVMTALAEAMMVR